MRQYQVTLTGRTPLLMHCDNIEFQDQLQEWRSQSENRKKSVAGDDRSPAFTWKGSCYHDGTRLAIPHDCVRAMLMAAATKIPKAKGRGSFKGESVSGILIDDMYLPFMVNGKEMPWAVIECIAAEKFIDHTEAVKKLGFRLLVKRAAVGQSKHIRVRPCFDKWSMTVPITVIEDTIDDKILDEIFRIAGRYVGLCDWRPGSKKSPGTFGQFEYAIQAAK